MSKKSNKQIKSYYIDKKVVETYDDRRFSGLGGFYISMNEYTPILEMITKKNVNVLDIGAGRGRLSIPLLNAGHQVYCLDSSQTMVDHLSQYFPINNIKKQSVFDPISFKTKFDLITSLRFFDHFSLSDQKMIILNLSNNLKNDGRIIIPTLNKNSSEGILAKLFPYGRYNYFYTYSEYKKLFDSLDFEIVDFKSKFFLPRGIFLKMNKNMTLLSILFFFESIFSKLFPKINSYYYFVITKRT